MSALEGTTMSGVGTAINLIGQGMLQEDAQAENRANMKMANRMGQAAQVNAARNTVQGYKQAGLSPALAAMGNFSPAQTPSAVASPMGSVSTPSPATSAAELANMRLVNAQAEKTEVEAERMRHEDEGSNQVLKSTAERILNDSAHPLNDDDRAYWESVKKRAEDGDFNLGDVQSQHNLENLIQNHVKTFDEVAAKLYAEQLHKAYLAHQVPETMAKMPEAQFKQLALVMGKINAETLKLNSDVVLNVAKQREIEANIQKLLAEAKSIYHGDIAAMWQASDYSALLSRLTYDTAQSLIGFVGMGKVAKGLGLGRAALSSPTMRGSVLNNVDRQAALSKKQYNARQWAETMYKRNQQLGKQYRSAQNANKRAAALENELQGNRMKRTRSGAFPKQQVELPF